MILLSARPSVRNILAPICIGFWISCVIGSGQARAADIFLQDDPVMGCNIQVTGVIEAGDADRLRAVIDARDAETDWFTDAQSPSGQRICFDSPGGMLTEGLEMASVIKSAGHGMGHGTAIPAGASCLSACALAFMAGSWFHPEGESWTPNRVMHPTATLGFHAPMLRVREGIYTADNIAEAYELALDSLSEIIRRRAEEQYVFSENLFGQLLRYSGPDSFFYIDTVGKAAQFRIAVAPSGTYSADVDEAILNLCIGAEAGLLDQTTKGLRELHVIRPPEIVQRGDNVVARLEGGFREEAGQSCSVGFHEVTSWQFREDDLSAFMATVVIGDDQIDRISTVSASQSFPHATPLAQLPLESEVSLRDVLREGRADDVATLSCWLDSASARITNVDTFVNMRGEASLSSRVVQQIPLGAGITLQNPLRPRAGNASQQRSEACIAACNRVQDQPNDRLAAEQVSACIRDNVIWYQVRDTAGNSGWISRNFLSAAGSP